MLPAALVGLVVLGPAGWSRARSSLARRQRDAVDVVLPRRIGDMTELVGDALVIAAGTVDLDAAVGVADGATAIAERAGGADMAHLTDVERDRAVLVAVERRGRATDDHDGESHHRGDEDGALHEHVRVHVGCQRSQGPKTLRGPRVTEDGWRPFRRRVARGCQGSGERRLSYIA